MGEEFQEIYSRAKCRAMSAIGRPMNSIRASTPLSKHGWREVVRARRQAREGEDYEVHHDVDQPAVEKAADDGVAREEAEARGRKQEERGPEERNGVVDGEAEGGHRQAAVKGGDSDKTARR